jgi:glycosyltransferase involved in cell wall biosynthesis
MSLKPMKILQVVRSVDRRLGGPVEAVKNLGLAARLHGSEFSVAALDQPGAPCLRDFPLPVYALGRGPFGYGFSSRFVSWLRENAPKYDVVVVNGIWQYQSLAVWQALHRAKTPYIVFPHGMLDPWFKRKYPLKHMKKWLYWPWAEYRVLRDAAGVFFTCNQERISARASFWLYKAKEEVISLGIASPAGESAGQISSFFERYPDLRGKRLALFMSRIHPKKGCDLVIGSFAQVLAADRDWRLVLAGPNQVGWRQNLEALAGRLNISHRITWTGMLEGDVKWGALRASEMLVLPSHQENFGIVVAEALACGTPVLISDQVNIWREISDAGAGLVQPDDIHGACELLKQWSNLTESDRRLMQKRAIECFAQKFEVTRATKDLLRALAGICGSKTSLPETPNTGIR